MKVLTKSSKTECEVSKMNFVVYYGSTRKQNMKKVLDSLTNLLKERGHSYTVVEKTVSHCNNCGVCDNRPTRLCCIKDDFPSEAIKESDGIIILSPIFFFSFSAKSKAFLDRLYSVNLYRKILTAITLSGSETDSVYCGFDIIDEVLARTSEYCGCKYVPPINFVTKDRELENIDISLIKSFVENLEV